MPSSFPPTNIERAHAQQRRSGNYDHVDLERGHASQQPASDYHQQNYQQPNSNFDQPSSNYQEPSTYQPPNSTYQQPNSSHQQPNANYQQPNANYQQGNVGSNRRTFDGHQNHDQVRPARDIPQTGPSPPRTRRSRRGFAGFLPGGRRTARRTPRSQNPQSTLPPRRRTSKWEVLRGHLVAFSGEFLGTISFLWFALSATQVATMTNPIAGPDADAVGGGSAGLTPQVILYISLAFGFSLAVNAWVFYRISGGLFNPAVVLGLCVSKALPWMRGLVLIPAQIAGAVIAAGLVQAMFPGDVGVTVTKVSAQTSVVRGLFIEMFCTSLLVFTILMLAAEKHQATFMAPIGIGLSLFVAELSSVYFTGGSLNPVRSFGPSVLTTFPTHHWIYWVGPAVGALMAAGYYRLVKRLRYEEANPGQDAKRE